MKTILAIIGTPTGDKGYTTKSVKALETALAQQASITVEYLYLGEAKLSGCQGFLTCVKHGEHECPYSASVQPILERMERADAVIFASPVHIFNVSSLLKTLFDLLVFQMHRPSFFGKPAVVVTAGAGAGMGDVLKYMRKTVANWGFEVSAKLGVHGGLFDDPRYAPKLDRAAANVAAKLLDRIDNPRRRKPGVADLINFRVWRSVIKRTTNASPYDWNYWQQAGWLEQNYYYETRVNPVSNMFASLIEKLIDRAIRNAGVKPLT